MPFSAPQEQGSSPALAFPRQPWLVPSQACPNIEPSWGRAVSWFCNFAIGIPHHNIMDKREELRIPEDLTVTEGRHITEDTSSGCTRCFFTFACCRERSGCAFQDGHLHQVRLSVSETLPLSLSVSPTLHAQDVTLTGRCCQIPSMSEGAEVTSQLYPRKAPCWEDRKSVV